MFIKNNVINCIESRKSHVGKELYSSIKTPKYVRIASIVVDILLISFFPYFALLITAILGKQLFDASKVFGLILGFTLGFILIRDVVVFVAMKSFDKACKKINDANQQSEIANIIEDSAHSVARKYKENKVKIDNAKRYSVYKADILGHRDPHTAASLVMIFITFTSIIASAFVLADLGIMSQYSAKEIAKGLAMFIPLYLLIFYGLAIITFGNCVQTNYDITPINLAIGSYMILQHIQKNNPDNLFLRTDEANETIYLLNLQKKLLKKNGSVVTTNPPHLKQSKIDPADERRAVLIYPLTPFFNKITD